MNTSTIYNDKRGHGMGTPPVEGKFWDRVADKYSRQAISNEEAYRHKLARTQDYFTKDSLVLEIGCGTGSTALEHATLVKEIVATDVSARMLEIAQEKTDAAGVSNIKFVQATASEALASNEGYDAILALNLLHLLPDWRAVINKAHATLKPGGVFVTSTLCLAEQFAWLRYVAPVGRRLGLMPELVHFRSDELKAVLLLDGFDIEYDWQADARSGLFLIARKL